jgi:adenylyltransferase/sulfurtransferase
MTLIIIPTPLRPYTEGLKEVTVTGATVGDVIKDLVTQYPGLKQHLFNDEGNLRPYVNIFINQEDVRTLEGEETPVAEGDRLMIVPSIAGGVR